MKTKKEIKNLSKDELSARLRESSKELFEAKMKKVTGQLTDTSTLWRLRKEVARLNTFMTAKK